MKYEIRKIDAISRIGYVGKSPQIWGVFNHADQCFGKFKEQNDAQTECDKLNGVKPKEVETPKEEPKVELPKRGRPKSDKL